MPGVEAGSEVATDCQAFTTFFQLFLGLVSVIVTAKLQGPCTSAASSRHRRRGHRLRPPPREQPGPADGGGITGGVSVGSATSSGSLGSQGSGQGVLCRRKAWLSAGGQRCLGWVQAAAAAVEAGAQHFCDLLSGCARCPRMLSAVAWWLVLSVLWQLALLLERHEAALPDLPGLPGLQAAAVAVSASPQ